MRGAASVVSRCHRTLKRMEHFRPLAELLSTLPTFPSPDEIGLGAYQNPDQSVGFVLSNQAVYIPARGEPAFKRLLLRDIEKVSTPSDAVKQEAGTLMLENAHGEQWSIRIDGGRGRFRDVFEAMRFFMRVRDDLRAP